MNDATLTRWSMPRKAYSPDLRGVIMPIIDLLVKFGQTSVEYGLSGQSAGSPRLRETRLRRRWTRSF